MSPPDSGIHSKRTNCAGARLFPSCHAIVSHTDPGPESGYLLKGELVVTVDGQPPKPLKAGESYRIQSGAIHDAKSGAGGAKVLAVSIVRKGGPLATSAK